MARLLLSMVILCVSGGVGLGDIVVPGADGSDGVFDPAANVQIDLSQAVTAAWDTPSPDPGKGVYDPEKWAVVFKYTSVNIASGRTVTFINHPSGAPVVWLVQGDVTIAGTVALNGENDTGVQARPATPGPGGFRGGAGRVDLARTSGGFGPGGPPAPPDDNSPGRPGAYGSIGSGGSYPGLLYGNAGVLPLIGGSGGRGYTGIESGGGAGGGAILIASPETIDVSGQIQALGGNAYAISGGGSGGAIRLVCGSLTGATGGRLNAYGGSGINGPGGDGRIRVEANDVALAHTGNPQYSLGLPGAVARIWPENSAPRIRAVALGDQSVPSDPTSRFDLQHDVNLDTPAPVTLVLEAENVPLDWEVKVRVVPKHGANLNMTYTATFVSGDASFSTWEAQIPALPYGFSAIQARASKP